MSSMVTKRRWVAGLVVGVVSLAAVGTGVVTASMGVFSAPPKGATIAVVDLEKLMNGLDEQKYKEEQFQKAFKAKEAELAALKTKIEERETAIKAMPVGAARTAAAEELQEMFFRGQIEAQIANQKLDSQRAQLFRDQYEKVVAAIDVLSKQNGYHMVLTSDQSVNVPKGNTETVLRAISAKRMLFIDKDLDVTDTIITHMNNAWVAAGGKPAAKPVVNANP